MTTGENPPSEAGAAAELVLVGGKIRTPADPSGFVQAAAIGGGVIRALGTDEQIREHAGPRTRVVNLRGRLVIPAFGDAHVHPVQGGLESLRCNLLGLRSRQECLDAIAAYSATLPPGAWVLGGGWSMTGFPGGTPAAADLDTVTNGRPAFLPNRDHHSAWVNTAALALAGITADTLDPPVGGIGRARGDPGRGQRRGVHPGAVVIAVGQERGPPARHRVEIGGGRDAAGKARHRPAAAEHPGVRRQPRAVGGDRVQARLPAPQAGQVAAQAFKPGLHRVHVRVAERGDRQPAAQVHYAGTGPDMLADLVVATQRDDHAAADRGGLDEAGRMCWRADLPAGKDEFRCHGSRSYRRGSGRPAAMVRRRR